MSYTPFVFTGSACFWYKCKHKDLEPDLAKSPQPAKVAGDFSLYTHATCHAEGELCLLGLFFIDLQHTQSFHITNT
jgi:hypothetical protein